MKTRNKFAPILYMCDVDGCGHPLQSRYSGEFVSCPDHKTFIDQTSHYIRCGGDVELDIEAMAEAWNYTRRLEWWLPVDGDLESVYNWLEEMDNIWEEES